jgi:hypothetical protein
MNLRSASLLLFPVVLAACSDDGLGPNSGDQMTRDEALMIAAAVSGSVETTSTAPTVTASPSRVAGIPFTFSQDVETSHPCPQGGNVALQWTVSGSADPDAGSFVLDLDGTHKPSGCAYPHNGLTFTLTGDPALSFSAHIAIANHQPSAPFTASISGAFNWTASDGRSGRCVVQYSESTDFIARQRTVDGEVCGHTVKETLSWS